MYVIQNDNLIYYPDELYHYGVKGMRWGVRRARKSSSTGGRRSGRKKGLTKKQKRAIKTGAAVAGTALAAYGAYKVGKLARGRMRPALADKRLRLEGGPQVVGDSTYREVAKAVKKRRRRKTGTALAIR